MANGKELFCNALKGIKGERVPMAILDGYTWMLRRADLSYRDLMDMEPQAAADLIYDGYNDLESDLVHPNAHLTYLIFEAMGGTVDYSRTGEAVELKTAPLNDPTDILSFDADEVWRKVQARPEFVQAMETTRLLAEKANGTKALAALSFAPFTVAAMLIGVQRYMEALFDEEDGMEALEAFALDMVTRFVQAHVNVGAEFAFICDPVASGDLISPAIFEAQALPSIQKIVANFNAQQVPVLLHICGNTEKRLAPLCGSGIAAFSLDSVNLRTALDTARGDYAIMGNMSPASIMLQMQPDEVEAHCRGLLVEAAHDAHFIMMPGCDLGPATPLANVQAMARAVHSTTNR